MEREGARKDKQCPQQVRRALDETKRELERTTRHLEAAKKERDEAVALAGRIPE